MIKQKLVKQFIVAPGSRVDLKKFTTDWAGTEKVHQEWLDQKRAKGKSDKDFWRERYEDINNFERHLTRNGTLILKFFLHLSKGEQKKRFLERLTNTEKYWKVSPSDMAERKFWA